jgi:hypothetical protein
MVNDDAALAWAAGLAIGEGSFFNTGGQFRFAIGMYDERAIRHFAETVQPHLFRKSTIYTNVTRTGRTNYRFGAANSAAVQLGQLLAPWLRDSDKWDQFLRCARRGGFDPLGPINTRGRARFSIEQALDLRHRYELGGETHQQLADEYNTNRNCIMRTIKFATKYANKSVLSTY